MAAHGERDDRRRGDAPGQAFGRVPPHDREAEAAVLSACLLSSEAFDQVQELIRPEHFYSDANRRVFEAVLSLQEQSRPVDVVTVAGWLRDNDRLEQIGGTPYLAQLTDATPAVAHVEAHAKSVREKWRLRTLIRVCEAVSSEGYGTPGEVQSFIDGAEQAVFDIARIPEGTSVVPVKQAISEAFNIISAAARQKGGITGIPTGFLKLDRQIAGLHSGDLYIVAARPGMGKTSFVLNVAVNVARAQPAAADATDDPFEAAPDEPGYGVAFFSLEMPREQLAARLLAVEGRVNVKNIRGGQLRNDDWNRLTEAAARLSRLPLWLDDTPALTLLDLRAKIRRLQAELARGEGKGGKRLGLVVIDYLQLMQGRRDAGSREQEVSELSRGLKQLAKEMKVSVIALSQLNRSVETRAEKNKRPQLSDLRESGAIEQDADTIFFIYREEYYNREMAEKRGIAEIIVAKQRNGPTGTVETRFTEEFTRFDNLELDEYVDGGPDPFDDMMDP